MESEPHDQTESVYLADRPTGEQEVAKDNDMERPKSQDDELVKINLTDESEEPRPIFLSISLPDDQRSKILEHILEFRDVFTWTYGKMPGLDSRLVPHKLNIKEGTKPVKQAPRNFRHELEIQIKQEIQKLLEVGFIKPIYTQRGSRTLCQSRKRMAR